MRKIARFALASVLLAAAGCADDEQQPPIDARVVDATGCGDCDAPNDASAIDASTNPDAMAIDAMAIDAPIDAPSSVQVISCTGVTPAATLAASNFTFTPQNPTINVNAVIRVTATGSHTFTSDTGLFNTNIGSDTCVRFTAAGSFPFHCNFHPSMTGTVVVN